jgi:hypothetical protein
VSKYITNISEWAAKCIADPLWLAECMQRIHRFGGQFEGINVLGHSMEVADRLDRPIDKLWGLLHDAHEVLSGDVTRQFKSLDLLQWQARCDVMLGMELHSVGIVGIADLPLIGTIDAKVGDAEHDDHERYMQTYRFRHPDLFASRFHNLLNECRNAQPE